MTYKSISNFDFLNENLNPKLSQMIEFAVQFGFFEVDKRFKTLDRTKLCRRTAQKQIQILVFFFSRNVTQTDWYWCTKLGQRRNPLKQPNNSPPTEQWPNNRAPSRAHRTAPIPFYVKANVTLLAEKLTENIRTDGITASPRDQNDRAPARSWVIEGDGDEIEQGLRAVFCGIKHVLRVMNPPSRVDMYFRIAL